MCNTAEMLFGENYTSDEKRTENAAAATTAYYYSYIL